MDLLDQAREIVSQNAWVLSGLRILFIVILAFVGLRVLGSLVKRFRDLVVRRALIKEEAEKRADTLSQVVGGVGYVVIIGIALMTVLSELNIDLKPIIAAAGIGGLAIGFGAQSLIKDIINGFFMLVENQVRVGDVVMIGDTGGVVENITLRVLMLRDLNGNLHIVPHGSVDKVKNMTHTFSYALMDIGVSYREDVEQVMAVMRRLGEELEKDPEFGGYLLEPLDIFGLDRFEDSAVVIRARFRTAPGKQWAVTREMNRRIKKRFDELGIEIPFPHRTLYFGVPSQGDNVLSVKTEGTGGGIE